MINKDVRIKKIVLFCSLLILIILGTFLSYYQYILIKTDIENNISIQNNFVHKSYNLLLQELKYEAKTKSENLIDTKNITLFFKNRDRKKLYSLVENKFKFMSKNNPHLKIMTFRLKDGSTFLRVHKPDFYGDKINKKRKIILDTIKSKKTNYGFEVGKLKMTYRVVTPIFYKKEFIGVVELGIEPEFITSKINKTFDIKTALLIKKEFKDVIGVKKELKEKSAYLLARGDEIFINKLHKISLASKHNHINFKNEDYHIETNLNLNNHKNEVAAKILIAFSVQESMDNLYTTLRTNIFVIILSLIILFIILNLGLNYFINTISLSYKKLQQNNEKLIEAQNIAKIGSWQHDFNSNQTIWSDEMYTILELKKDEFSDKYESFLKILHPDDREKVAKTYKNSLKDKLPYQIKYRILIKDEIKWLEERCKTTFETANNQTISTGTIQDITKDYLLNEEVSKKEMQMFAQAKMAAMGEMIANIAHQWRQPLSVISTEATGIKVQKEFSTLDDATLFKSLDNINNYAQYLSKTIDTFRDFIKEDKVLKEVLIHERVEKVLTIVAPSLKNNYIKVINNISANSPIKTRLVAGEFSQVIINIINNAKDILVSKKIESPWIKIEVEESKDKIVITIEDNAGGVPPEIISKIFNPYFTTKGKSEGTGLGLHMSYKIMTESIGGSLYVKNSDKGAKFFIEIPII